MSVGDIFLNPELNNYSTMTGSSANSSMVYVTTKDKKIFAKQIGSSTNVIPTISLDKELLKKGKGTIDSPYEME